MTTNDSLTKPEICVLGGGFGGLHTALRLASMDWEGSYRPRVTLVDQGDRFVFLPMLYELTTGEAACWEIAPLFEEVLASSGVEFVHGRVCDLDEIGSVITVQEAAVGQAPSMQRLLPYTHCVLALGAEATFSSVPGVREHAHPFYSLDDALCLRRELLKRTRTPSAHPVRVIVVGGSYVGVELVANLAAWLPRERAAFTLVHSEPSVLEASAEFTRVVAQDRLVHAGVEMLLCTSVEEVSQGRVTLRTDDAQTTELLSDVVIWAAGSRPSNLPRELGLPVDTRGRVSIDSKLRVTGRGTLWALGDVAGREDGQGNLVPSTAAAAEQQASFAAENIRASLRGDAMTGFRYAALGEMLSLGGSSAAISALGGLKVKGPLAAASRRAVYAAKMPTASQAVKVGLSWAMGAARGFGKKMLRR